MTITIHVLGPVGAARDGDAVQLGGPQVRALLAALTVAGGAAVTRETLIDHLWPEDPPASAAKVVQKHVSTLRSHIGEQAIQTTGGGYRLTLDPAAVDVVQFERAVATAAGIDDAATRAAAFAAALDRWSGEPYSGIGELPFARSERARLDQLRLSALADALEARIELGQHEAAIAELAELGRRHPENERVAGLLMRALYVADRQADALRTYRQLQQHLLEELGVDPSPEIKDLELRILEHDTSLRPAAPTAAQPAPQPAPAPPEEDHEEVRSVSLLMVSDPPGSTDPEDVRSAQEHLVADMDELAARFGGRRELSVGGRVGVLFGVPAHDDDPQRAVEAGRSVLARRPQARVGIASGAAIVSFGPAGRLIAGSIVDIAADLVERAAPGELVLGEDFEAQLESVGGPGAAAVGPLVGRATELGTLQEVWSRVTADGRHRAVHFVGEPGIGKTRVVRAATAAVAPRPGHVLESGFQPYGEDEAATVIAGMLAKLADRHDSFDGFLDSVDLPDIEREWLRRRLTPLLQPGATTVDVGQAAEEEWGLALVRLLEALAESAPVMVIIEDVHWAGSDFEPLIADLSERLSDHPVMLVTTRRPEPSGPVEVATSSATEQVSVALGPLDPTELTSLAAALAEDALPEGTIDLVVERCGGNPLFLQQYVRMLLDQAIVDVGGEPPASVRLVISARLDYLDPDHRALLQAASVLGDRLDAAAVAAVVDRPAGDAASALRALTRSGLLRRSRTGTLGSLDVYEFHHALVADVAYGQLTRARRLHMHRAAAEWLQAERAEGVDDLRAIAWQWGRVLELTRAAGLTPDDALLASARDAHRRAGDRLLHIDARLAIAAFEQAVELAPEPSIDRAEILMRLGQISTDAGDFETATWTLEEAAETFARAGATAKAGEATARLARMSWYLGHGRRTDDLLETAFGYLEGVRSGPELSHAGAVAASQRALRGDAPDKARELAESILPTARATGTTEDVIRLLHTLSHARFDLDDADGIDLMEEALALSLDRGFSRLASQSYNNLAELRWPAQGPRPAIELTKRGLELAHSRGLLAQAPWHAVQLAELRYDAGDWDQVLDPPEPLDTSAERLWVVTAESLTARIRFWRGDDAQLDELFAQVEMGRAALDRQIIVPVASATIAACAAVGRNAEATALGEELVDLAGEHPFNRLREAGEAARGLVAVGRADLAAALLPADPPRIMRRRLQHQGASAVVAEALGAIEDAAAGYADAERGWAGFPHPLEAGHAALGLARCARQLGDDALADAAAARATQRFEQLGASRLLRLMDD